jgi:hypothetical protein
MENEQLGRRNLTTQEQAYMRGQEYIEKKSGVGRPANVDNVTTKGSTAQALAKTHGVSEKAIRRDGNYTKAVDQLVEAGESREEVMKLPKSKVVAKANKASAPKDTGEAQELKRKINAISGKIRKCENFMRQIPALKKARVALERELSKL